MNSLGVRLTEQKDNISVFSSSNGINNISQPAAGPRQRITPDKILKSFNSRAFRREQPSDPHLMLQLVSEAVASHAPIKFVLYWGKGPRSAVDKHDIECLEFLASFATRVSDNFEPGANLKLIFTDTHAQLNGHSSSDIRHYFTDIELCAFKYGFSSCWLSDLLRTAGATDQINDEVPQELGARLVASAKKWYRGSGTAEEGACKYYRLNMIELRAVELLYPKSIFITYNSPDFRHLCPTKLPVFYMYTLRRGYRIKPWFLPAPA